MSIALSPSSGRVATAVACAAVIMTVLLFAGCNDGDNEKTSANGFSGSPETAIKEFFQTLERGEWEREWMALHPEQQKLIPQDVFVKCAEARLSHLNVKDVKVLAVHPEDVEIPGTSVSATAEAIVVRLPSELRATDATASDQGTCVNCAISSPPPATGTYHLFRVDGRWRWVVANPEDYSQENCR